MIVHYAYWENTYRACMHINKLAMILWMDINIRVRIVLLIYYCYPIRIGWIEWMTCSDISSPPCPSWYKLITISFPIWPNLLYWYWVSGRGASALISIPYGTLMVRTRFFRCYYMVALAWETVTDNYIGFNKYQTWLAVYNFPDPMGSYHWLLNWWPVITISGNKISFIFRV